MDFGYGDGMVGTAAFAVSGAAWPSKRAGLLRDMPSRHMSRPSEAASQETLIGTILPVSLPIRCACSQPAVGGSVHSVLPPAG